MEGVNLSSPSQVLSASPFCLSSSSPDAAHSSVFNPQVPCESGFLQKLSSNLEVLISPDFDDNFSDALIYVAGRAVPVHRCILAARCAFFRALFSKDKAELASLSPEGTNDEAAKLRIDLKRLFNRFPNDGSVGYDAFMVIVGFLYSGKSSVPNVKCIDNQCLHEACRPVVEFAVEMLYLSSALDISELRTVWQERLIIIVEKAQVDDVLPVLVAANAHGAEWFLSMCKHLVAVSNIDTVDLEKQLPSALAEEVIALRLKQGLLQPEFLSLMREKECQRIRKALDSDDVELVDLLLKEGRISLDGAHALHYATSYCDPRTVQEILERGLADPNLRNNRGFTVLHVASMRRDPVILVNLLSKGANPLELTPDGRTALQLCRRLIRSFDQEQCNVHAGEESHKDTLSVEILDQAGKKNPFADTTFPPVASEEEFFMRLLYLENRVAVARLLFPQQAKLVVGLSHLEATSEFTGLGDSSLPNWLRREVDVDLNIRPPNQFTSKQLHITDFPPSAPTMNEALLKRAQALQKTVELGKRLFPRCIGAVNNVMDDDLSELSCIEKGSLEEQTRKKCRYSEMKDVLADAFRKDVAAMDRHRSDKVNTQISLDKVDTRKSSSSSSSKRR